MELFCSFFIFFERPVSIHLSLLSYGLKINIYLIYFVDIYAYPTLALPPTPHTKELTSNDLQMQVWSRNFVAFTYSRVVINDFLKIT